MLFLFFFFFSSRRRHTRLQGDWSSDVCSSDLCKEPYTPPADLLQKCHINNPDQIFYRGKGCPACGNSGYSGRMGIYEMLRVKSGLKELISKKAGEAALRRTAAASGTRTLME